MSAISTDSPLAGALLSETRRSLLALLFLHPDVSYYLRQILRLTGKPTGTVQRELANLTRVGIITRRHLGNLVLYQVNPSNPIFPELKSIVVKTFGVGDELKNALAPIRFRIKIAFIYGSFSSLEYREQSDIDIIVIGEVTFSEVVDCLASVQGKLGREINAVVMDEKELKSRYRNNNHFIKTVLSGQKTILIGDEYELGKLVEGKAD